MAKSTNGNGGNGNGVQQVPSVALVPRSAGGLGGVLFQLMDDLAAGKKVDVARVNATCKVVGAYGSLVRTFIAQEKFKSTGADELVIDHAGADETPTEDASSET